MTPMQGDGTFTVTWLDGDDRWWPLCVLTDGVYVSCAVTP